MTDPAPFSGPQTDKPAAVPQIFDRRLLALRRRRAARRFADYSFLKARAAEDIADRLSAINRRFLKVLDLGAQDGSLADAIRANPLSADRVEGEIIGADIGEGWQTGPLYVCADEEALPFAEGAFDLVVSALCLHWVNDLPGALIQIRRSLKPDGFLVAALFGRRTLNELREALVLAETEIRGGAGLRVSPFLDVQDGARLLQRAGFAMPVADTDLVTVRYDNMFRLLADLKGMGETACFADRRAPPLTRAVLSRAAEVYAERFSDPDGRVRATFEIIALSGWAPAADQPQPLKPGSAKTRLADALGTKEIKL